MTQELPEPTASQALAAESASQSGRLRGALLRNSLAQVANVAVSVLTGLALTRIIVQELSLASYGFFNTALSISLLFVVLADLGFSMLTVREMNRYPERASGTFARLTVTRFFIGVGVVLAAGIASRLLDYPDVVRDGILILTISGVISGMTLQFGAYFQAKLEAIKLTWCLLAGTLIRLFLAAVLLLPGDAALRAVFYAYLVGAFIGLFTSVWLAREALPAFRISALQIGGLRAAFVLGVFAVLGVVHFRVDVLLLSLLRPPADVGAYGVAYRIYEPFVALYSAFAAAFYPVMARTFGDNPGEARRLLQRSFDGLTGFSLGLVPLGIVGAPLAVLLLSGSTITASVDALHVLMLGLPIVFSSIFGLVPLLLGYERWLVLLLSGAVLLNILLNLILIPISGAVGAAIATLVSEFFSVGSAFVLCTRVLNWQVSLWIISKYVAASALTLASLLGGSTLIGDSTLALLGLLFAGAIVYGILCLAFGAVNWDMVANILHRRLPQDSSSRENGKSK